MKSLHSSKIKNFFRNNTKSWAYILSKSERRLLGLNKYILHCKILNEMITLKIIILSVFTNKFQRCPKRSEMFK